MKMQLVKYNLDAKEEPEKYQAIQAAAKALGHKLMDAWHPSTRHDWLDRLPDEVTIEPAHLFANQYNTAEGFRVHDWYEEIYWRDNGTRTSRKKGYYLTGEIEALKEAKANRYECGYCGKQYDKSTAPAFCHKCLGSEYLKEDQLYLLLVRPIADKYNRAIENAPPELVRFWHEWQPELKRQRKEAELERMKKKADRIVEDAKKKAIELVEEANIKAQLLRHGISTENLIYYSHTKRWCFGWREKTTEAQRLELQERLRALPNGEMFLTQVDFK